MASKVSQAHFKRDLTLKHAGGSEQNANVFVCYFFSSSFSRTRGSQTVCGHVFFSLGSINDSDVSYIQTRYNPRER